MAEHNENFNESGKSKAETEQREASVDSSRTHSSCASGGLVQSATKSSRNFPRPTAGSYPPELNCDQAGSAIGARTSITCGNQAFKDESAVQIQNSALHQQGIPFNFKSSSLRLENTELLTRPRTSGGIIRKCCINIVSPKPRRPASSQSRIHFSKILDIEEGSGLDGVRFGPGSQLYDALETFSSEKRPSVRPLTSQGGQSESPTVKVSYIVSGNKEGRTSQNTSREKSTLDSLLDSHIECLGLTIKPVHSDSVNSNVMSKLSPSFTIEHHLEQANKHSQSPQAKSRPASRQILDEVLPNSSNNPKVLPERPVSSMDGINRSLTEDQVFGMRRSRSLESKCSGDLSTYFRELTGESKRTSMPSAKPSLLSGELADISSEDNTRDSQRETGARPVPSPSALSQLSHETALATTNMGYEDLQRRIRLDSARNVSQRRKMRTKLKMRRDFRSSPCLLGSRPTDFAEKLSMGLTGRAIESLHSESIASVSNTLPNNCGECVPWTPVDTISGVECDNRPCTSPTVPERWPNVLAVTNEHLKTNGEVSRKVSAMTVSSNGSNAQLMDRPDHLQSGSRTPGQVSVHRLAFLGFGPDLSPTDLNLNISDLPSLSTQHRNLEETKGSPSWDCSTLKNLRSSFRRKLRSSTLQSRMDMFLKDANNAAMISSMTAHRSKGQRADGKLKSEPRERQVPLNAKTAFSDFAVRKRKVLERVKEWWNKGCVRRGLGSRRMKEMEMHPTGPYV